MLTDWLTAAGKIVYCVNSCCMVSSTLNFTSRWLHMTTWSHLRTLPIFSTKALEQLSYATVRHSTNCFIYALRDAFRGKAVGHQTCACSGFNSQPELYSIKSLVVCFLLMPSCVVWYQWKQAHDTMHCLMYILLQLQLMPVWGLKYGNCTTLSAF